MTLRVCQPCHLPHYETVFVYSDRVKCWLDGERLGKLTTPIRSSWHSRSSNVNNVIELSVLTSAMVPPSHSTMIETGSVSVVGIQCSIADKEDEALSVWNCVCNMESYFHDVSRNLYHVKDILGKYVVCYI